MQTFDLATAESSSFLPHIGSQITLATTAAPVAAELLSVTELEGSATDGRKPFSLLIKADSPELAQDTYEVSHPILGTFPLFLVPIKIEDQKLTLEAIFT